LTATAHSRPAADDRCDDTVYAGIRPKISARGAPAADFLVQGSREHGVPGLVHLFGIESPGLTASLPLADAVIGQLLNDEGAAL
jgi:L-2-hydroxyglutarate oxidase LhgO